MASQVSWNYFYGFYILFQVQFTAIRARVSVITCYAHSEKVELQYWLLLMLPHVGLVCIKYPTKVIRSFQLSLTLSFTWHDDSPRNEEIKSVESFQNISTWLDAQWWLVEHSDWTWAKATSWLDLGSGPVGREREIVVPSWITWTHGLLDRWWSRDYYFEPHNSDPTRSLHADCWDTGFCCPKGRYDLVSLIISIYIHLFKLKICHFFNLTVAQFFSSQNYKNGRIFQGAFWNRWAKNFQKMAQLLDVQMTDFQDGVSKR